MASFPAVVQAAAEQAAPYVDAAVVAAQQALAQGAVLAGRAAAAAAPAVDAAAAHARAVGDSVAAAAARAQPHVVAAAKEAAVLAERAAHAGVALAAEAGPAALRAAAAAQAAGVRAYAVAKPRAIAAYYAAAAGAADGYERAGVLAVAGVHALEAGLNAHVQPVLRGKLGLAVHTATLTHAVLAVAVFLLAFAVAGGLKAAATGVASLCGCGGKRVDTKQPSPAGSKPSTSAPAAPYVASKPGKVYACRLCAVALPGGEEPTAVEKHVAGKRHVKAVADATPGSPDAAAAKAPLVWMETTVYEAAAAAAAAARAAAGVPAPSPAKPAAARASPSPSTSDDEGDDAYRHHPAGVKTGPTRRTVTTSSSSSAAGGGSPKAASSPSKAPPAAAGASLHGKNVAVVEGTSLADASDLGGGWTKVKGGAPAATASGANNSRVFHVGSPGGGGDKK
jgi:hypothetical protein